MRFLILLNIKFFVTAVSLKAPKQMPKQKNPCPTWLPSMAHVHAHNFALTLTKYQTFNYHLKIKSHVAVGQRACLFLKLFNKSFWDLNENEIFYCISYDKKRKDTPGSPVHCLFSCVEICSFLLILIFSFLSHLLSCFTLQLIRFTGLQYSDEVHSFTPCARSSSHNMLYGHSPSSNFILLCPHPSSVLCPLDVFGL